jgi:hypothetical protein
VQCQSMSLQNQLNAGIRVFDVRLGPDSNGVPLDAFHGSISQAVTFDTVIETLSNFLLFPQQNSFSCG